MHPLHEKCIRHLDLAAAMGIASGWMLDVDQPAGGATDASIDVMPARLCFTAPANHHGFCKELRFTPEGLDPHAYPLQTVDDVSVAPIPDGQGGTRKALLVRASYSGGAHGLHALLAWRYSPDTGFDIGPEIHVVGDGGEQRFITTGPLAGYFVQTSPAWTRQQTLADPEPLRIEVDRVGTLDSYRVLALLTPQSYATPVDDGPPPQMIDRLTPHIADVLKTLYPHGVP